MSRVRMKSTLVAASLAVFVVSAAGQTKVTAPKNKYSPADDVKLGQEAAREVEKEVPVMRDERINSYLNGIGRRLLENIPAEFRHPEFRYSFTGVNMKEINAFALPGGPMYINRGMIEKARNEGEVAGVMAHELSHVALRHGTAQQTKATGFAIGQIAGQIAGAIIGGRTGQIIAQGSQFGLGTYFLKYGREYEKQSDLLGSRTSTDTTAGMPDRRPNPGVVAPPDRRMTTYNEGNMFRVSVPSNWRELASNNSVTFAPEGAYGTISGQSVFTHGMEIGVSRNENH